MLIDFKCCNIYVIIDEGFEFLFGDGDLFFLPGDKFVRPEFIRIYLFLLLN